MGTIVTAWPVPRQKLPQWIDQRLQRKGLKADTRALDILAEKVEGNLLAAMQEIEKLALLVPCLLYTSPSPRDRTRSRMPSSA